MNNFEKKRKALLVGINYKNSNYPLDGCLNDIDHMKDYLINVEKLKESDIFLLKEEAATKSNILNGIRWLIKDNKNGDSLLFQFSGHGSQVFDYGGDEKDGLDEIICPFDIDKNQVITDDELRVFLVNKINSGCNLTCIFDSCSSGTICDLKYQLQSSLFRENNKYKETIGNVFVISSCFDSTTCSDAFINNKSQGALTWSLLEVLKILNNKTISFNNFQGQVQKLIDEKGFFQKTQISIGNSKLNHNSNFTFFN